MKTSELSGLWLDYWVARAEERQPERFNHEGHAWVRCKGDSTPYSPSTSWALAGPIIDRERIGVCPDGAEWCAQGRLDGPYEFDSQNSTGPTPLVAAMRWYVKVRFGAEVPDS